ncbi:MAG: hypothetical protein MZU95_03135 [Desulfomicrobium escambiense]|nr:hypothetical protein [Desulfomicrobium escambiense]
MAGLFIKKDLAKLISDAKSTQLAGEATHGAHAAGTSSGRLTAVRPDDARHRRDHRDGHLRR